MRDDSSDNSGDRVWLAVADGDGFCDFIVSRDVEYTAQELMRVDMGAIVIQIPLQKESEGDNEQDQQKVDNGTTFVNQLLRIVHIVFPNLDDDINSIFYNLAHLQVLCHVL
jgi:hypothetical protein